VNLQFVEEGGAGGGRRRDGRWRWGHSCHFGKRTVRFFGKTRNPRNWYRDGESVTGVCFVLAFYDLLLDFGERIPGNLLVFCVVDSDVRIFSDLVSRQILFCFLIFFFFFFFNFTLLINTRWQCKSDGDSIRISYKSGTRVDERFLWSTIGLDIFTIF